MGNIKVETMTERKIIPVRPGMPSTSPDRIEVDVCLKCGAVVFDLIRHDTWHRAAETHEYVQGEPTDAAIESALNAYWHPQHDGPWGESQKNAMRRAFRAVYRIEQSSEGNET